MRGKVVKALCAVTWLCVACACTLEPRYRAPALPVLDQWPMPTATFERPGGNVAARDIGWLDFFLDTRLEQLIDRALANNRDLRVAVLNIEQARAQYQIQRAALLPSINGGGSFTREKLPASLNYGSPTPISGSFDVGLSVTSYEVDLFGRVRSLTHAALEKYVAQEQARRSAQLSLIAEVAHAYLTLASDRELERLAQETLASEEHSFTLEQRRHETGTVSGLDLAQSQTTVELARADTARFEGHVAQDIDALTLLVGTSIEPALLPAQFDSKTMGLEPLPAGVPSAVLSRRSDVLEAEHTLRAANANIGAARAAFFPDITLTANLGSASNQLSNLFKSGTGTWAFEPLMSLPIFHGRALMSGLDAAHVNEKIALAQYDKAIQSGFREVADALALTTTLNRQRAAQESLVEATSLAYRLSQRRYKVGRDSYLEVLDSQRSDYAARQGLITTRLAEQSNRVTLYKVLGGGWREQTP
ncbi:MAG: putative efflux pump outer membrane protein ttgC [Gammaproteobacteria bacterium]|nr:putative efflux pump outer membrane protein ttgC [Gammaproteobacteria bacterium]